jgi:enolase
MKIQSIHAREIIDSRGNPTLEAEVTLSDGSFGRAAVPSGASTGTREAVELRDNDKTRYLGKGVLKAVGHVKELIQPALVGKKADDISALDEIMLSLDGTEFKSKLGANATLGVSMAACRALAQSQKRPLHTFLTDWYYSTYASEFSSEQNGSTLPLPMMNILNGGKHADNNLSIQEFMILPAVGQHFSDSLRAGCEIFHYLKKVLHEKNHSTNVGDEGGFAPNLQSNDETLELIIEAIGRAGYRAGQDVFLALDAAASSP